MTPSADPVSTENVTARLVAESDTVAPGGQVAVLLHLEIREGWHTYWRNPGDTGLPTKLEWQIEGAEVGPPWR